MNQTNNLLISQISYIDHRYLQVFPNRIRVHLGITMFYPSLLVESVWWCLSGSSPPCLLLDSSVSHLSPWWGKSTIFFLQGGTPQLCERCFLVYTTPYSTLDMGVVKPAHTIPWKSTFSHGVSYGFFPRFPGWAAGSGSGACPARPAMWPPSPSTTWCRRWPSPRRRVRRASAGRGGCHVGVEKP